VLSGAAPASNEYIVAGGNGAALPIPPRLHRTGAVNGRDKQPTPLAIALPPLPPTATLHRCLRTHSQDKRPLEDLGNRIAEAIREKRRVRSRLNQYAYATNPAAGGGGGGARSNSPPPSSIYNATPGEGLYNGLAHAT
jgi:hypothetical protein